LPSRRTRNRLARAKPTMFTVWVHSASGTEAERANGSFLPSKPGSFLVSAEGGGDLAFTPRVKSQVFPVEASAFHRPVSIVLEGQRHPHFTGLTTPRGADEGKFGDGPKSTWPSTLELTAALFRT
jgi:hypothetical protein